MTIFGAAAAVVVLILATMQAWAEYARVFCSDLIRHAWRIVMIPSLVLSLSSCAVALPKRWDVRPLQGQASTQVSLDKEECQRVSAAKAGVPWAICMVAHGYEVKTWLRFSPGGGGFRFDNYLIAANVQMTESEVREAFLRCRDETHAALASITPPYIGLGVLDGLKVPVVNLFVLPLVPLVLAEQSRVNSQSEPIVERTFPACMARNGLRTITERWGEEPRW